MRMVALIPARAGSKRVPGKNTRDLNGQPLIAYTIAAAQQSGVFARVVVCSDDSNVWKIAYQLGAEWFERAPVSDTQRDVEWIREVLEQMRPQPEAFAILRPTSPFRTADTIRRAYQQFCDMNDCVDSIRAVRPVTEHPYKMWRSTGPAGFEKAYPIKPLHEGYHADGTPWHSSPTQSLPTLYVQTSALEMAWTRCVEVYGTISGRKVAPFFGSPVEFCSIDTPDDWDEAERLARTRPDLLSPVDVARVSTAPAALP
jgi:CMP-N,N'-diacetyllegionaminic acid synthase